MGEGGGGGGGGRLKAAAATSVCSTKHYLQLQLLSNTSFSFSSHQILAFKLKLMYVEEFEVVFGNTSAMHL